MNTADWVPHPPLSLRGPVCVGQRTYFIRRAHLRGLGWERGATLAGNGHIMIRALKDDREGRGQFGLTRSLEKKPRTGMQLGQGPEVEMGILWAGEHGCKGVGCRTQPAKRGPVGHQDKASQDLPQVTSRVESRDCNQTSHAGREHKEQ